MRCKHAKLMISASTDRELSQREELALERHLARCAECAREEAELSHLRDAMALWVDEEPSPWLAENFAHRLKVQQEKSKQVVVRRPRWLVGTAAAGLATALLAFGILVTYQLETPLVPPTPSGRETSTVTQQPVAKEKSPPATRRIAVKPGPTGIAAPEALTPPKVRPVERRAVTEPSQVRRTGLKRLADSGIHTPLPATEGGRLRNGRRDTSITVSRGGPAPSEAERLILRNIVAAGITNECATGVMTDELGEAALVVNETIEMVRGTLRKAADTLAASYAARMIEDRDSIDFDRGGSL